MLLRGAYGLSPRFLIGHHLLQLTASPWTTEESTRERWQFRALTNRKATRCKCRDWDYLMPLPFFVISTEMVDCNKKLLECQARGLQRVVSGHLWPSNTCSCGPFQQMSTSRMSDSSRNFVEILKDAYESYLILNVGNRTLLEFWNLSQRPKPFFETDNSSI